MKKVLVLSDIHGNLEALKAVIAAVGKETFDETDKLFLGDYVDFGPWPDETLSFLQKLPHAQFILGNHDLYVLDETNNRANTYFKRADLIEHINWTRSQIRTENKKWLAEQKEYLKGNIADKSAIVFHGDYKNAERGLSLEGISHIKEEIILCGHVHAPYVKQQEGKLLVNPGSVGESLDGDNRSSYALIEINGSEITCHIERVSYDLQSVESEMEKKNMPVREEFLKTMTAGKFYETAFQKETYLL